MSANLLQMSKFGGNGDESLKIGINNIFSRKATFEIKHYIEKLVSITTNGASVNTRQHHGRMTQMKKDRRDWLVPIYCVYRWVELVLKDAFDQSGYNEIDKLCLGIHNLYKNSGAIKTDIHKAAETLNISVYSFSRLTGSWFIPHRCRGLTLLFSMWPAIVVALENTIVVWYHRAERLRPGLPDF